jgi:hypothetical protein
MTFPEKIAAVQALGFTERQARFLVLVMQTAGVCVPRQFATFARTAYGQRVNRFVNRLVRKRFAVRCACVHNRAHVFHVQHRALYTAIGDPHSRFRRPVAASRVVERLMRLDAVLPLGDVDWLTTDAQKAAHLAALSTSDPACPLPTGTERWPWGIDGDGRTLFVFLVQPEDGADALRGFLRRHLELWRALPTWRLRLVFPRRLVGAREEYQALVEEELERPLDPHTAEALRTSFEQLKSRCSRIHSVVEMELHVERVLRLPRLVRLYTRWLLEGDAALTGATSRVLADALATGRARVESLVLSQEYRHLSPLL